LISTSTLLSENIFDENGNDNFSSFENYLFGNLFEGFFDSENESKIFKNYFN
jgi:hypothetical protein